MFPGKPEERRTAASKTPTSSRGTKQFIIAAAIKQVPRLLK
jgi:hypothetical protein